MWWLHCAGNIKGHNFLLDQYFCNDGITIHYCIRMKRYYNKALIKDFAQNINPYYHECVASFLQSIKTIDFVCYSSFGFCNIISPFYNVFLPLMQIEIFKFFFILFLRNTFMKLLAHYSGFL